jgi:hypothetical protein
MGLQPYLNTRSEPVIVVVASSPEICALAAESLNLTEYIPVYSFATAARMTGKEEGIVVDASMDDIPLADRILIHQYCKALNANPYNGFGYRTVHPDKADAFVLDICEWLDVEDA